MTRPTEAAPVVAQNVVAGDRMERSLADFVRACEVLIVEESEKPLGDTALIALLCDAVRLTRERVAAAMAPIDPDDFAAGGEEMTDDQVSLVEALELELRAAVGSPDYAGRCAIADALSALLRRRRIEALPAGRENDMRGDSER